jgi:GT2 family glycosyltransferase
MSVPRISIVTPSYEQHEYLRETLDSVRWQSYPDVEHVVVDGGSEDGSVDLLAAYAEAHADTDGYRLRWVSESDRGQSHAVNKGVEMATGEWVGWQNSDDRYVSGAFEAFAAAVERRPEAEVVYGDLDIVDHGGRWLATKYHTHPSAFVQRHWSLFTATQCTFFRRRLFRRLGGLDESLEYAMDVDLFWRLLESEVEMAYVPRTLGAHRRQPAAKSSVAGRAMNEEAAAVTRRYGGESVLPDRPLMAAGLGLKAGYLALDGRFGVLASKAPEKVGLVLREAIETGFGRITP